MRTSRSLMLVPAALTLISGYPSAPLQFSDTLLALLSNPQPASLSPDLKPRMDMPDSPRSSTEPTSWRLGTQLPVSYRVAIAVDAFVLLITICSLVLLGVYIRRQYRRRRMGLLSGQDAEFGFDDESEEEGDVDIKGEEAGRSGKDRGAREGQGDRRKKGHVRWTSSVVGMGVFVEWDVSQVEGKRDTIGDGKKEGEKRRVHGPKDAKEERPYRVEGVER